MASAIHARHIERRPMTEILLLNGPNLGILADREPEDHGRDTRGDTVAAVNMIAVRSGSAAGLIRAGHALRFSAAGAIVNPGALVIAGREPAGRLGARAIPSPVCAGPAYPLDGGE
ncbi:type II 3-dehydroquinate dehydratase [Micromonospora sp. CA-111912]|uniref:type II 3-dehydroquinate dehydratase n=1 Tax=Micromonospora sp. CA-111912 TaxID=3239955 RepID=UPI003D905F05